MGFLLRMNHSSSSVELIAFRNVIGEKKNGWYEVTEEQVALPLAGNAPFAPMLNTTNQASLTTPLTLLVPPVDLSRGRVATGGRATTCD